MQFWDNTPSTAVLHNRAERILYYKNYPRAH